MTAPARTRPADVAGGLEVRKTHRDTWQIHFPDGVPLLGDLYTLRLQKTARKVRALLLGAVPDWTGATSSAWPDTVTADQRQAAREIVQMVRRVRDRQFRGCCLGCGCRRGMCCCGTDRRPDGTHYTPAELEWTR